MLNEYIGQRRWEILRTAKCWLKIIEMVAALLIFPLLVSFHEIAMVSMKNRNLHFTLSLAFPFVYEENITVQTPPDLPVRQFKFDSTLLPSSIAFVAVTAIALVLVVSIFAFHIARHGTPSAQSFIKWEFFISLGVALLLVASTSLWLFCLVKLKQSVEDEIKFIWDICDKFKNADSCEKSLPNYATLYLSTLFAYALFFFWLVDGILIYRTMVYTIPQQISQGILAGNVELVSVQDQQRFAPLQL